MNDDKDTETILWLGTTIANETPQDYLVIEWKTGIIRTVELRTELIVESSVNGVKERCGD